MTTAIPSLVKEILHYSIQISIHEQHELMEALDV